MLPYINLFGRVLPTYGICLTLGFVAAYLLAYLRTRKTGRSTDSLLLISVCAAGAALICAKGMYLAVSVPPGELLSQLARLDFRSINGGGLVFYGGLLGSIPGALLGAAIAKDKLYSYEPMLVPAIPLGHAFGRVGCFLSGCCYGIPYDGPFHVTRSILTGGTAGETVFPVQLLEAFLNLVLCFILLQFSRHAKRRYATLFLYLTLYGIERFLLEFLRGDAVRGFLGWFSTSQWISLAFTACSVIFFAGSACIRRLQQKRSEGAGNGF